MRTRATLAAASLAVGVLALGTPAASAADSAAPRDACTAHWTLKARNPDNGDLGEACYHDNGNWANVDDQEQNGRSVVLAVSWGGKHSRCWDHKGHEGNGTPCYKFRQWADNKVIRGRLCPAEWSKKKANRDIKWKHCTNFKKFQL